MKYHALAAIQKENWAIQPDMLLTMLEIATRTHEYADGNLEALETKLGRPLGNTERAYVRGSVAVIPVQGAVFRYANIMTEYSGATSFDMLAKDFSEALDNPDVKSIVLKIDSPGGTVSGTGQFAEYVNQARGQKEVIAFVDNMAASAAYWIAAAASRIVSAKSGMVGSIGVQSGITFQKEREGVERLTFTSSQSPNKNSDPRTDAGKAAQQKIADDLAQVFIDSVAAYRGTTSENVLENYGQGAVFVASEALSRGMIDAVDTFEGLLASLQTEVNSMDYTKLTMASLTENRADLVAEIKATVPTVDVAAVTAQAAADERKRIADIEALSMPGAESVIAACKSDGTSVADAAMKIIAAAKAAPAPVAVATPAPAAGSDAIKVLVATETQNTMPTAGRTDDQPDELAAMVAQAKKTGVIRC